MIVDSIYPLEEVQKAHQRIEDSEQNGTDRFLLGKIVFTV